MLEVCYKRAERRHWGHGGNWSTGEKGGGWRCCRRAPVRRNRRMRLIAIEIPANSATGNRVPRLRGPFDRRGHGHSHVHIHGRPVVRWLLQGHREKETGMAAWRKSPNSRPGQDWNESFCVEAMEAAVEGVVEAVVVEAVDVAKYIASAHRSPF